MSRSRSGNPAHHRARRALDGHEPLAMHATPVLLRAPCGSSESCLIMHPRCLASKSKSRNSTSQSCPNTDTVPVLGEQEQISPMQFVAETVPQGAVLAATRQRAATGACFSSRTVPALTAAYFWTRGNPSTEADRLLRCAGFGSRRAFAASGPWCRSHLSLDGVVALLRRTHAAWQLAKLPGRHIAVGQRCVLLHAR